MKKKIQSGQVPAVKLQCFFTELSTMLQGSEYFFVRRAEDGTTSIRLQHGEYLTISMQEGGSHE